MRLHEVMTRPNGTPTRLEPVREVRIPYLDSTTLKRSFAGGPVLFKGLAGEAPAIRKWTFEALLERYGEMEQAAQKTGAAYSEKSVLKVSEILRNATSETPTYALRAGSGNFFNRDPKLKEELHTASWVDSAFLDRRTVLQRQTFNIAGKGHWTPTHSEMCHVLSIQVRGSRRWTMYEPRFSPYLFPETFRSLVFYSGRYANASRLRDTACGLSGWQCEMEEGDVLLCPAYHWHFVETLRPSISVATQLFVLDALVRHPVLTAMLATSRNPSVLGFFRRTEK